MKILKLKHVLYFAAVKTWTLKDQGFFSLAFVTPRCFLFTSFYVCIYVRALPFTEVLLQGENRNRNKLHKNQTEFFVEAANENVNNANKLTAFMGKVFPGVVISTDQQTFDEVVTSDQVQKYKPCE